MNYRALIIQYGIRTYRKKELGLLRPLYLGQIKKSLDNNLIKIIKGQRRSGKSYLLRQTIDYLVKKKNVDRKNILYLNFEIEAIARINSRKKLSDLIKIYLREFADQQQSKIYFLFDEIQEIPGWEKSVNSLVADPNIDCEIFVTGSNSKLLSGEFATYLTGRYIEIDIFLLSYQEYLALKSLDNNKQNFLEYINSAQTPEFHALQANQELQRNFLNSLKNSILYQDIVSRYTVKHADLLDKFFLFIVDNIGNPFSLNSIGRTLKHIGIKANLVTLSNYLKYLEEVFLIASCERYDIKGKRILEGEKKYYISDIGFKNFLSSSFDPGVGKKLENYVYWTLKRNGFHVSVGNINASEVDFIAEKSQQKIYIQVTYLLNSENVVNREYASLENIRDNWPKIVTSLDDVHLNPKNGIEHLRLWLLEDRL
jgi:predicted AAA+ superfamily ATPase